MAQDNGFGDADDSLKKFNHQHGTRAHDGDGRVLYAGARLQGNVGDHVHYADQEASSG